MDKYKDWKDRVHNLLKAGCELGGIPTNVTDEQNVADAIDLISYAAVTDPAFLLYQLFTVASHNMAMLALAALISNAPDDYLSKVTVQNDIHEILIHRDPDQLLELVEYLKAKIFMKGFGSRPQKMVRKAMESWIDATLKRYIEVYPKSLYALLRLVHPRYRNSRGEMIQNLLNSLSKQN
jgi:hypothetical protein